MSTTQVDFIQEPDLDDELPASVSEVGSSVQVRGSTEIAAANTAPATITDMLHFALEKNLPVETLERLVALHERVSDRAAASEFATALAEFQDECPPIAKTKKARILKRDGTPGYEYKYAELDQIARTVRPFLHSKGLSYSWDSSMEGKTITCICTLRHINGHSTTASFTVGIDNPSGMSEQQKHAAALTYARRQSLIQILGITTAEPDTDAADPETITEKQAVELKELLTEVEASEKKFLEYMGVDSIEEIRKSDWNKATRVLIEKRRRQEGAE